ncbi:Asp23/Gls24 family envelope stress response protein [Epidermidibacterium keratini]|uniref:Asp23/Gls24 family envelope stress response protein n=1 Tax=Epidermidibacterium keratini TaxID=1891644 RepID=A0A7L4YS43_9ACTN|nr:Asp23/Gls24 family envelope stress response protein [Epidermidibacterium keratini]QHC01986.1 Asp23/Gls24 family envelope stress response protein [Epidermidibacterium keratini]
MSDNSETRPIDRPVAPVPPPQQTGGPLVPPAPPASSGLAVDDGTLTFAEVVIAKIAALAAREVSGVHNLGVGTARSVTAVRDRLPGVGSGTSSATSGVSVEVGKTQTAIDLDLVVEYGTPITEIARDVRRRVISVVEQYTGLQVVEVNITVDDINLPALPDGGVDRLQ